MANARYFLPDHPTLKDVYSKNDLRAMLIAGELSRSDMVLDDETGHGHFLGDLLAMPYPDVTNMPSRSTTGKSSGSTTPPRPPLPPNHEFRADTPLPRPEADFRPPSQRRSRREEDFDEQEHAGELEKDAPFEEDDFEDGPSDDDDDHAHEDGTEEDEEDLDEDALNLNASAAGSATVPVHEWRPGNPYAGVMRPPPGRGRCVPR